MKTNILWLFIFLLAGRNSLFAQQPEIVINRGHSDFLTGIAMSDSKQLFVTASFDGQFKIWDSNTKCEMASAYLALSLVGAKFAMHDSLIVAFNRENIFVYNIAARVTNSTFSDKDGIDAIDVLDNNLFYLTHTSGTVKKISLKGNHAPTVLFSNFDPVTYSTHDWLHTETLQALRVIRNKKLLASVSTYSNELVIYDITNDRKLTEWSIHDKSQIVTKPSMDIDEIQSTINFACGDSITRLRYSQDGRFEMQHIFTKYAGRATLTGLSCVSSSGDIIAAGPGAPGEKKIFILHPSGNIETAHFDSSRDFRILSVQFNPVKNEILAGGTDGSLWTIDMDSHVADLVIGRLSWITNIFSAYDSAEIFIARVGTDGYQIEKRQKSSLKVNTRIYTNFEAVYPLSANQFLGIRNDTVELDISGNNHLLYYSAPIIIPDSGVQQSTGSKENVSFDRFAADTTGNIFYFFFNDPLNKIHFFNVSQLDTFRKKQIYLDKGYEHVEENSMAFGAAQLTGIKASASGDHLLAADINHILYYINQITSEVTKLWFGRQTILDFGFFNEGNRFYIATDSALYTASGKASSVRKLFSYEQGDFIRKYPRILVTSGDDLIVAGTDSYINRITLDKTKTYSTRREPIVKINTTIFSLAFFNNQNRIVAGLLDNSFSIIDIPTKNIIVNAFPGNQNDELGVTSENRVLLIKSGKYLKPKSIAGTSMYIKNGAAISPLDFYDVFFNRPDEVLAAIDSIANSKEIAFYRRLHVKQLNSLGLSDAPIDKLITRLPVIKILDKEKILPETREQNLEVTIAAGAVPGPLTEVVVLNNGCSIPYAEKIMESDAAGSRLTKKISFALSVGENNIQFFCITKKGLQSLRTNLFIRCVPATKPGTPLTYVLAIALTKYADQRYNLQTAASDGAAFLELFRMLNIPNLVVDSLFDGAATKENMMALAKKMKSLGVNDKVIVYYGGHGLLDKNLDYYLSGFRTNFDSVSGGSIRYKEFIDMLKNILPRQKLFFIDACHSREIPKQYLKELDAFNRGNSSIGGSLKINEIIDMFGGTDNFSGIDIIGSSESEQRANEDTELKHSYFMQAILQALSGNNQAADFNNDNVTTLQELKKFILTSVLVSSREQQLPAIINTNLYNQNWVMKSH